MMVAYTLVAGEAVSMVRFEIYFEDTVQRTSHRGIHLLVQCPFLAVENDLQEGKTLSFCFV